MIEETQAPAGNDLFPSSSVPDGALWDIPGLPRILIAGNQAE